jgi:hypothetical protein
MALDSKDSPFIAAYIEAITKKTFIYIKKRQPSIIRRENSYKSAMHNGNHTFIFKIDQHHLC